MENTNEIAPNKEAIGTIAYRPTGFNNTIKKCIKVAEPDFWKRHDRYIWEKKNGQIPKGYTIRHKNGDINDDAPDNLELSYCWIIREMHDKKCERCEKDFKTLDFKARFCSVECYKTTRKEASKKNCKNEKCNKEFYGGGKKQKFCCFECSMEYKKQHGFVNTGSFQKGNIPWNKGKSEVKPIPHSPETAEAVSSAIIKNQAQEEGRGEELTVQD